MYVRTKTIKGHTYYYLVEGHRVGGKVKQKVIKYLGKGGWDGLAPTHFIGIDSYDPTHANTELSEKQKKIVRGAEALDCEVSFNYRSRKNVGGFQCKKHRRKPFFRNRRIKVRKDADFGTLCHEFGHLIDYELQEHGVSFAEELEKIEDVGVEIEAIGEANYPYWYSEIWRWEMDEDHGTATLEDKKVYQKAKRLISGYVETPEETFANVFELCLTDPKKAYDLAPKTSALIMKLAYEQPKVRDVLTRLEVWELGTTD